MGVTRVVINAQMGMHCPGCNDYGFTKRWIGDHRQAGCYGDLISASLVCLTFKTPLLYDTLREVLMQEIDEEDDWVAQVFFGLP